MKKFIQPFEIVIIIVTLFMVSSTSFFWYERFIKSAVGNREREVRLKWEDDVTKRLNKYEQWGKSVTDIINQNIQNGTLKVKK